jgi:hypothetical protein
MACANSDFNSRTSPRWWKELWQHRVTKLSPQPAGAEEFARLFEDSMVVW